MAFGFLKKIAKVALPIAGTALLGPLGGVAGGALGGAISGGGVKGALTGAALGGLGGLAASKAGGIKALLGKLGQNPARLAQLGIAGLGTLQSAKQQGQANQVLQSMLARQQAEAADQGRARQMLMARLGQARPTAPNLSPLFQSSSPFARAGIGPSPAPGEAPASTLASQVGDIRSAVLGGSPLAAMRGLGTLNRQLFRRPARRSAAALVRGSPDREVQV